MTSDPEGQRCHSGFARATCADSVPNGPVAGSSSKGMCSASRPPGPDVTSAPSGCVRMIRCRDSGSVWAK
jgi:hypothetical protein